MLVLTKEISSRLCACKHTDAIRIELMKQRKYPLGDDSRSAMMHPRSVEKKNPKGRWFALHKEKMTAVDSLRQDKAEVELNSCLISDKRKCTDW